MQKENRLISRMEERLFRSLGHAPENGFQRARGWMLNVVRIIYVALCKSRSDRIQFKAYGLTFTTALSIVPFLAVSFSVAKGFGMAEALREVLFQHAVGVDPEIIERILNYVENTNVRTLGMLGTLFLFYTVTKTLSTMEDAFNEIWDIPEQRPLYRKFTDYFSVILVCPLLFLAAATVTASLQSASVIAFLMQTRFVGSVVEGALSLIPYGLAWIAIAVLYQLLPNTRVPVSFALSGAFVAGVLWQMVQSVYITFQIGVSKYNAIYGSFASLPLFLIWLYVSWSIILLGAEISQGFRGFGKLHPRSLRSWETASFEPLALKLFLVMSERFYRGAPAWTVQDYAMHLGVNPHFINAVFARFLQAQLAAKLTDSPTRFHPARDLDTISLADILDAVRDESPHCGEGDAFDGELSRVLREVQSLSREKLAHIPVRRLVGKQVAPDRDSL